MQINNVFYKYTMRCINKRFIRNSMCTREDSDMEGAFIDKRTKKYKSRPAKVDASNLRQDF